MEKFHDISDLIIVAFPKFLKRDFATRLKEYHKIHPIFSFRVFFDVRTLNPIAKKTT